MGWLDVIEVGLDVANVAINVNNAAKLEAMRQQGAAAALVQAVLQELRNQIFQYKQAAENILNSAWVESKQAAAAMRFLEIELQESGITVEMFPDLMDKEYAANTIRLIQDNSRRMLGMLPMAEQAEIKEVAFAASQLPECNYYLTHYREWTSYTEAQEVVAIYGPRNSASNKFTFVISGCFVLMVLLTLVFSIVDGMEGGLGILLIVLVLGGSIWGVTAVNSWMNAGGYNKAKETVAETEKKLDVSRFKTLASQLGSKFEAEAKQRAYQKKVEDFFAGTNPLTRQAGKVQVEKLASIENKSTPPLPVEQPIVPPVPVHAQTSGQTGQTCTNCGAALPQPMKFCFKCGHKLAIS